MSQASYGPGRLYEREARVGEEAPWSSPLQQPIPMMTAAQEKHRPAALHFPRQSYGQLSTAPRGDTSKPSSPYRHTSSASMGTTSVMSNLALATPGADSGTAPGTSPSFTQGFTMKRMLSKPSILSTRKPGHGSSASASLRRPTTAPTIPTTPERPWVHTNRPSSGGYMSSEASSPITPNSRILYPNELSPSPSSFLPIGRRSRSRNLSLTDPTEDVQQAVRISSALDLAQRGPAPSLSRNTQMPDHTKHNHDLFAHSNSQTHPEEQPSLSSLPPGPTKVRDDDVQDRQQHGRRRGVTSSSSFSATTMSHSLPPSVQEASKTSSVTLSQGNPQSRHPSYSSGTLDTPNQPLFSQPRSSQSSSTTQSQASVFLTIPSSSTLYSNDSAVSSQQSLLERGSSPAPMTQDLLLANEQLRAQRDQEAYERAMANMAAKMASSQSKSPVLATPTSENVRAPLIAEGPPKRPPRRVRHANTDPTDWASLENQSTPFTSSSAIPLSSSKLEDIHLQSSLDYVPAGPRPATTNPHHHRHPTAPPSTPHHHHHSHAIIPTQPPSIPPLDFPVGTGAHLVDQDTTTSLSTSNYVPSNPPVTVVGSTQQASQSWTSSPSFIPTAPSVNPSPSLNTSTTVRPGLLRQASSSSLSLSSHHTVPRQAQNISVFEDFSSSSSSNTSQTRSRVPSRASAPRQRSPSGSRGRVPSPDDNSASMSMERVPSNGSGWSPPTEWAGAGTTNPLAIPPPVPPISAYIAAGIAAAASTTSLNNIRDDSSASGHGHPSPSSISHFRSTITSSGINPVVPTGDETFAPVLRTLTKKVSRKLSKRPRRLDLGDQAIEELGVGEDDHAVAHRALILPSHGVSAKSIGGGYVVQTPGHESHNGRQSSGETESEGGWVSVDVDADTHHPRPQPRDNAAASQYASASHRYNHIPDESLLSSLSSQTPLVTPTTGVSSVVSDESASLWKTSQSQNMYAGRDPMARHGQGHTSSPSMSENTHGRFARLMRKLSTPGLRDQSLAASPVPSNVGAGYSTSPATPASAVSHFSTMPRRRTAGDEYPEIAHKKSYNDMGIAPPTPSIPRPSVAPIGRSSTTSSTDTSTNKKPKYTGPTYLAKTSTVTDVGSVLDEGFYPSSHIPMGIRVESPKKDAPKRPKTSPASVPSTPDKRTVETSTASPGSTGVFSRLFKSRSTSHSQTELLAVIAAASPNVPMPVMPRSQSSNTPNANSRPRASSSHKPSQATSSPSGASAASASASSRSTAWSRPSTSSSSHAGDPDEMPPPLPELLHAMKPPFSASSGQTNSVEDQELGFMTPPAPGSPQTAPSPSRLTTAGLIAKPSDTFSPSPLSDTSDLLTQESADASASVASSVTTNESPTSALDSRPKGLSSSYSGSQHGHGHPRTASLPQVRQASGSVSSHTTSYHGHTSVLNPPPIPATDPIPSIPRSGSFRRRLGSFSSSKGSKEKDEKKERRNITGVERRVDGVSSSPVAYVGNAKSRSRSISTTRSKRWSYDGKDPTTAQKSQSRPSTSSGPRSHPVGKPIMKGAQSVTVASFASVPTPKKTADEMNQMWDDLMRRSDRAPGGTLHATVDGALTNLASDDLGDGSSIMLDNSSLLDFAS